VVITKRRFTRGYQQLQEFVEQLAALLLPRGVTPRRFGEVVRTAFVQAAANRARLLNGRVNYSRVAAQTGLSRADVKRLLQADSSGLFNRATSRSDQTPVERVISGWRQDSEFTTRHGTPRTLSISGPSGSFRLLVKKHGGDVPHRAVLEELKRARVVTIKRGVISLNNGRRFHRSGDLSFLGVVMPALMDGLRIASGTTRRGTLAPHIQRVHFPVASELDLAIVRDRCSSSVRAMLEGLGHSLGVRVTRSTRAKRSAFSFTVTVILAEHRLDKGKQESAGEQDDY